MTRRGTSVRPDRHDKEELEYRVIFALAFTGFLVETAVRRLFVRRRCAGSVAETRKSVVAEAYAAARTCVPFAFMG